jgi:predicted phage terminase large subunit-like protein
MTTDAPAWKLQLLKEWQTEAREQRLEQSKLLYPTPGHLARALDPLTVQTPALDIIDREMVMIRDAVEVMYARRRLFAQLVEQGVDQELATIKTAEEIPDAENNCLIISMPPQEGKSSRVTRYGILWLLEQFQSLRIGLISYADENASQFSYQIRNDIELFNGSDGNIDLGLRLAKDQKAMSRWSLSTGGSVYAVGIGGGLTGRPFDILIIDDPVKDVRAADSLLLSSQSWEWWQTAARTRLAPWAPVVIVATRWHEMDLSGRMLLKQAEDEAMGYEHYDCWRVVNVPAQADHDPNKGETDILGREPGEFMVSARGRTRAQWEATKGAMVARFWSALYQGKPSPSDGDIWLKSWWRRYDAPLWSQAEDGSYRLDGYDVTQSWDLAFKDTKKSDYVVGQVWAKKGADSYLIYQVWARLDFPSTLDAVKRVTKLFPQARRKIIEDKANGPAVIASLKHEISGIIGSNPSTSKTARAVAVAPFIRAGNVHLPTTYVATMERAISWDVGAFLHEVTAFGSGPGHDDQVDATSQYLEEVYLHHGEGKMFAPTTRLPTGTMPGRGGPQLSPFQRRLTQRQLTRPGG